MSYEFTKEDFKEVRKTLLANKKPTATSARVVGRYDVTVPIQSTGLEPETTFLSKPWASSL